MTVFSFPSHLSLAGASTPFWRRGGGGGARDGAGLPRALARWARPGAHPRRCGCTSAAPRPLPPPPRPFPRAHSFGSAFFPPLPSARVLGVPSHPQNLPPPVTFGSPEPPPRPRRRAPPTPSSHPTARSSSRPPLLPRFCAASQIHTPFSLRPLRAAAPSPPGRTRGSGCPRGPPRPPTCAATPSNAVWTAGR